MMLPYLVRFSEISSHTITRVRVTLQSLSGDPALTLNKYSVVIKVPKGVGGKDKEGTGGKDKEEGGSQGGDEELSSQPSFPINFGTITVDRKPEVKAKIYIYLYNVKSNTTIYDVICSEDVPVHSASDHVNLKIILGPMISLI